MGNMVSDFFKGKPKAAAGTHRAAAATAGENPYLHARREWNERYGDYIARTRTWQIVAVSAIGLAGALGLALVHQAGQAKVQPFIVQVDKLGEAVAVKPADAAVIPDERIIRFQLANFIRHARSITPDNSVQKGWLDGVYQMASPAATQFLNEFYKQNDPFTTAKQSMVSVDIVSAPMPLSEKTWQVQWQENKRNLNGMIEGTTRWQAVITVGVVPPTTPAAILNNPTGVFVDQVTWTQQL